MVCQNCGWGVRWLRSYFEITKHRDIKLFCEHCSHLVTITREDADRQAELMKLPKDERRMREGLCTHCGKRPASGGMTCEECKESSRERKQRGRNQDSESIFVLGQKIKRKTYDYRRYYGLCVLCENPTKNSARICEECRKKYKANKTLRGKI